MSDRYSSRWNEESEREEISEWRAKTRPLGILSRLLPVEKPKRLSLVRRKFNELIMPLTWYRLPPLLEELREHACLTFGRCELSEWVQLKDFEIEATSFYPKKTGIFKTRRLRKERAFGSFALEMYRKGYRDYAYWHSCHPNEKFEIIFEQADDVE